mgnify:CR=1 FL=1
MNLRIWICKNLTKNIERKEQQILKFKIAIDTLQKWIKQNTKELNKRLKKLSIEENLEYGLECGFINKEEFEDMRIESIRRKNE